MRRDALLLSICICLYVHVYTLPIHTHARLEEYVSYHVINPMPTQIKELGKVENTLKGSLLPGQ